MKTQTEALKMALEALDQLTNAADTFSVSGVYFNEEVWAKKCLSDAYFAITTIEEALAQQEGQSNYCLQCEALSRELAALKAQQSNAQSKCNHTKTITRADIDGNQIETTCGECGERVAQQPQDVVRGLLSNEQVEPTEVRLWDLQWINVVNHDNCYQGWSKEDAINHAVKMTEKYIASNFANNAHPPVPYVVEPRTAQRKEPEQEPVAMVEIHEFYENCAKLSLLQKLPKGTHNLYTIPPQRTWVGLTEEEKQTCIRQIDELGKYSTHTVADDERLLIDVVESKLRSKNA